LVLPSPIESMKNNYNDKLFPIYIDVYVSIEFDLHVKYLNKKKTSCNPNFIGKLTLLSTLNTLNDHNIILLIFLSYGIK